MRRPPDKTTRELTSREVATSNNTLNTLFGRQKSWMIGGKDIQPTPRAKIPRPPIQRSSPVLPSPAPSEEPSPAQTHQPELSPAPLKKTSVSSPVRPPLTTPQPPQSKFDNSNPTRLLYSSAGNPVESACHAAVVLASPPATEQQPELRHHEPFISSPEADQTARDAVAMRHESVLQGPEIMRTTSGRLLPSLSGMEMTMPLQDASTEGFDGRRAARTSAASDIPGISQDRETSVVLPVPQERREVVNMTSISSPSIPVVPGHTLTDTPTRRGSAMTSNEPFPRPTGVWTQNASSDFNSTVPRATSSAGTPVACSTTPSSRHQSPNVESSADQILKDPIMRSSLSGSTLPPLSRSSTINTIPPAPARPVMSWPSQQQPSISSASPASNMAPQVYTDYTATHANLDFRSLSSVIDGYIRSRGGEGCLNHTLERPRFNLLTKACRKNDGFYLLLHQVFCIWTANREQLMQFESFRDVPDAPFKILAQLLRDNQDLSQRHLTWFTQFPILWADVLCHPSYLAILSEVALFLRKLEFGWTALLNLVKRRGYPPLIDEFVIHLGLKSPVLQDVALSAARRGLAPDESTLAQEWEKLYTLDKRFHSSNPYASDSSSRSQIGKHNAALVQQYLYHLQNHHRMRSTEQIYPSGTGQPQGHQPIALPPINTAITQLSPGLNAPTPQSAGYSPIPDTNFTSHVGSVQSPGISMGYPQFQGTSSQASAAMHQSGQPLPSPGLSSGFQRLSHHSVSGVPQPGLVPSIAPYSTPYQSGPQATHALSQAHQYQQAQPIRGTLTVSSNGIISMRPSDLGIYQQQLVARGFAGNSTMSGGTFTQQASNQQYMYPGQQGISLQSWGNDPSSNRNMTPAVVAAPFQVHQHRPGQSRANARGTSQGVAQSTPPATPSGLLRYLKDFARTPEPLQPGQRAELVFNVPGPYASRLVKKDGPSSTYQHGSIQYRLRAVQRKSDSWLSINQWAVTETCWPDTILVNVNGKQIDPKRKMNNSHKDLPVDLGPYLSQHGADNRVSVSLTHPSRNEKPRQFAVAIEIIETIDQESTIRACSAKRIPAQSSLQAIMKSISGTSNDDDDDDFAMIVGDLTIDVADPFMAKIWDLPARGVFCTHRECFDLRTFLTTRNSNPKTQHLPCPPDSWRCPLCNKDARPVNLVVDDFLLTVRQELATQDRLDCKAIIISADGKWKPRAESESRKRKANEMASDDDDTDDESVLPRAPSKPKEIVVIDLDDD